MNNLNKGKIKNIKKANSNVLEILQSKKIILKWMKAKLEITKKRFLKDIKERTCFKDEDWFGFENKDWHLTDKWARDALNHFDEYWWEENTAHDQWYLSWYNEAIQDLSSIKGENNIWVTKEELLKSIEDNPHFKDILLFQLKLETKGEAILDLRKSSDEMYITWKGNEIEFFKENDNEPSYKHTILDDEVLNIAYDICNLIKEVEEKWSKECNDCWWERTNKMFDIDWINLEEINTCNDCWLWTPSKVN